LNPRIVRANLSVRIKSFYREKSAVFFTVALPIILILVFGSIFTKQDHMTYELPVQDLDQTQGSAKLLDALAKSGAFKTIPVDPAANAREYARLHKLNLLLVIPKGFEDQATQKATLKSSGLSTTVTYIYDPSSTSTTNKILLLNSVFEEVDHQLTGTSQFIKSKQVSILDKKYRFIEFFVPGIIAMSIMTLSLSGALNINAELRQKGIIRKLATTPITRTDWVLSNVLYHLILAVLTTTTILVVSYAVFSVSLEINLWLPLLVVLEVFTFVGIGMILTRIAKEAESAAAAGNAIMFPVMFLSGTFFPLEMMPVFLQKFARVLPLYYVNEGLRAAMVFLDQGAAVRNAAVIGAIALVVFVVGIASTKWEEGG
jgi:ABC-2 type transport system permease protein